MEIHNTVEGNSIKMWVFHHANEEHSRTKKKKRKQPPHFPSMETHFPLPSTNQTRERELNDGIPLQPDGKEANQTHC